MKGVPDAILCAPFFGDINVAFFGATAGVPQLLHRPTRILPHHEGLYSKMRANSGNEAQRFAR